MKKHWMFGSALLTAGLLLGGCGSTEDATQEEKAKETETAETETSTEQDSKINPEKSYYSEKTRPSIQKVSNSYDDIWQKYWVVVWEDVENEKLSIPDMENMFAEGFKKYDTLKNDLLTTPLPTDGLNKENKALVVDYVENMVMAIDKRQLAMQEILNAIERGQMNDSVSENVKNHVSEGDGHLIEAVSSNTSLESHFGYLEEDKK